MGTSACRFARGIELRRGRMLLAGVSFLLAIHSLVVSNVLPSSLFLIVAFCWLWVGSAALYDRLEAARAMAVTATVVLLVVLLTMQITASGSGDLRAFYFLAMFPALTAWACAYVFIRHLQNAEDVTGVHINSWFEEQEAANREFAMAFGDHGEDFTHAMVNSVSQDDGNSTRPAARRAQG